MVKTTVLLADINDFAAVNEVYTKFFSDNYPARAAYQVSITMSRISLVPSSVYVNIQLDHKRNRKLAGSKIQFYLLEDINIKIRVSVQLGCTH